MNHQKARTEWRKRWSTAIATHRVEVLGMSQPEMARFVGTSQSTVAMWESGGSVPNDLMKVRVIALLGLDAREMFAPLDADPIRRHDQ